MKRRAFIKGTIATGIAASAALVAPNAVFAAIGEGASTSKDIKIKAPEIAENGNVVPITVTSDIAGTTSIALYVAKNPNPKAADFTLSDSAVATVKTRVKMGKSSDVIAVVKAGGKTYKNQVAIKVTKGGCGG